MRKYFEGGLDEVCEGKDRVIYEKFSEPIFTTLSEWFSRVYNVAFINQKY